MKHSAEWKAIRKAELAKYRAMSYQELTKLVDSTDTVEVTGESGTRYSVMVDVSWDGRRGGAVRVIASIDDGCFTAVLPKSEDFIMQPDGSFIGERS